MRMVREGSSWSGRERNCAFLNCADGGDERFANISSVSGLDFSDDGRALATVDWDQDGDVDLWSRNRTGPRLRLMINQLDTADAVASVALKLEGSDCNRDAIGARVELRLVGEHRPIARSLHAGNAFLSQSSKWLHFGIGDRNQQVENVTVHWPGGKQEGFSGITTGGRYLLRQGRGEALVDDPRGTPQVLAASDQEPVAATTAAAIVFPAAIPLPTLDYLDEENRTQQIVPSERPLWLILWAPWCPSCVAELAAIAAKVDQIREADLDVLVLSVDVDAPGPPPSIEQAAKLAATFPFPAGKLTAESLDKLDLVQKALFDRHVPLAVPVSFLLDTKQRTIAMYRGRRKVCCWTGLM